MKTIPNPEKAFSQPCGCGTPAGESCPHTPIRCPHNWHNTGGPQAESWTRECLYCGRVEKRVEAWETVVA